MSFGEMSAWRNVLAVKCPSGELSGGEMSSGEKFGGEMSGGEMSGHPSKVMIVMCELELGVMRLCDETLIYEALGERSQFI